MATVLVSSAESGTAEDWTNASASTLRVKTGDYSFTFGTNGSTRLLKANESELWLGVYQSFLKDDITPWTVVSFYLANGGDQAAGVGFDALGRPYLTVRGVQQPGFGDPFEPDAFTYIALHLKVGPGGAGGGEVRLYVDGDPIIEIDEIDTRPGGSAADVDRVVVFYNSLNPNRLFWDDLTINDSSGTAQNGVPNGIRYLRMDVDGDGNYTAWDPLNAGDHYVEVDETPPDDADYVYTSTGAERDSYTLESSGAVGLPAGATIELVQQVIYVSEDEVSANTVDTFVRLAGADDDDGLAHTLPLVMGRREGAIRHEKPGGGAWGASDLDDSLEIGILS